MGILIAAGCSPRPERLLQKAEQGEKAARAAPVTNIGVVNLTQDFKADDPERIFHRAAREMVSELNQLHQHPDHSPAARHT